VAGDFQNARQLLQALHAPRRTQASKAARQAAKKRQADPATRFHLHRQAQAQRARTLGRRC
jgi:predicted RNA binding protein with dsRBD fold (UPF0201 family)